MIHGIQVFVPILIAQDVECHVVNTASMMGFLSYFAVSANYHVTKHAVVALSEQLYHELAQRGSKVKVSVLCPGAVNTRIMDSGRNRPAALQDGPAEQPRSPAYEELMQAVQGGMSPHQVADRVVEAVREEKFYILTHPEYKPLV